MKKNNIEKFVLNHVKEGKKPICLCKQLKISKQLLSYYLRRLREKGLIKKLGQGVWKTVKETPKVDGKKEMRNHAIIWKIELQNSTNWDKREQILTKLKIPFIHTGNTIRIKIRGKKIWLTNSGMIIYEPKSFFESTPIKTRKLALYELDQTMKSILNKLKINSKWNFSIKREHIGKIKDLLAVQCNKEGERLRVIDKGEAWMEIDNSFNLDETEFYKTKSNSAVINATGYQGYYNSHKDTKWKVTPEFILNTMNGIQQNQLIFDKNMKSHLEILNKLGKAVDNLTKTIKKKNVKNKLNETQMRLNQYE